METGHSPHEVPMRLRNEPFAGAVPLERLGKGPRRDPPIWARSVRLLLGYSVGLMRGFYEKARPGEVWMPALIAVCGNGDVAPMMQAESIPRDAWAGEMRRVFRDAGVVRYVLTMEAWMSMATVPMAMPRDLSDPALDRLLDAGPAPEADPARREVAFAFACERRGRSESAVLELVRGDGGRVVETRDVTHSLDGGHAKGAFGPLARLFEPDGRH